LQTSIYITHSGYTLQLAYIFIFIISHGMMARTDSSIVYSVKQITNSVCITVQNEL